MRCMRCSECRSRSAPTHGGVAGSTSNESLIYSVMFGILLGASLARPQSLLWRGRAGRAGGSGREVASLWHSTPAIGVQRSDIDPLAMPTSLWGAPICIHIYTHICLCGHIIHASQRAFRRQRGHRSWNDPNPNPVLWRHRHRPQPCILKSRNSAHRAAAWNAIANETPQAETSTMPHRSGSGWPVEGRASSVSTKVPKVPVVRALSQPWGAQGRSWAFRLGTEKHFKELVGWDLAKSTTRGEVEVAGGRPRVSAPQHCASGPHPHPPGGDPRCHGKSRAENVWPPAQGAP